MEKHVSLITGGTSGLGLAAALHLARQYPSSRVIVASRKPPVDVTLPSNVSFQTLDLSSFAAIRTFVDGWTAGSVSALFLNAVLQTFDGVNYTADGLEATFGITHVGHALLFFLLKQKGLLSDNCRIVIVASGVHDPAQPSGMPRTEYISAEDCGRPTDKAYLADGRRAYVLSKLSNILWTYALARRISEAGKGWAVTAMDPGLMPGTGLARAYSAPLRFLWNYLLPRMLPLLRLLINENIHTVEESGAAMIRLGTDSSMEVNGKYFEGTRMIKSSLASYEAAKQEDLWNWTLQNVATSAEERRQFEGFEA